MDAFLKKFFPSVYEKKMHSHKNNYCKFNDQGLAASTPPSSTTNHRHPPPLSLPPPTSALATTHCATYYRHLRPPLPLPLISHPPPPTIITHHRLYSFVYSFLPNNKK
ncbi:hypothetical protein Hanom_Chr03g00189611 [Helianthus anomalus]